MKALFSWISKTIFRMNAAENDNTTDYFEKLFGNATEGRLPLFSDENPFHRTQDEGFGADFDGTSYYGKKETDTEKCQVFEESKNNIKNDKGKKQPGQVNYGTETQGDGVGLLARTKKFFESDEDLDLRKRKKKKKSSANYEVPDGNGNDDCTDREKKKMKEVESTRSLGQRNSVDISDIRIKKHKINSGSGDLDIRKEEIVRKMEEAFTSNDNLSRKKKKMKEADNITRLRQRRIESKDGGGSVEILDVGGNDEELGIRKEERKSVDISDIRIKKHKINSGSGEDLDIRKEEIVRKMEEAFTSNGNLSRKKKKMNEAENITSLRQRRIESEDGGGGVEILEVGGNDEELGIRKEEIVRGIEEFCTSKDDFTRKKKKMKMNKFVEGSSVGEGNIGLSEEGTTNLRFTAEAEDGNDVLLGTKRKDYVLDDVALSRMKKKRRIAMDENVQSVTEGESHLLEEKVMTNNRKRAFEHDNNEPSKRYKVNPRYCDAFEVAVGPGSSIFSKLEVKSDNELTEKSLLGKRKRDAIEEEYEARHGFGDSETLLKEGGGMKKVTGKRKWGDEAADMVVKKDSFDDGEKLERTVFVGNLPSEVKRKKLIREFSQFGEVESVRLRSIPILDTKLPRKGAVLTGRINESINSVHAYIVFKDLQSANAALSHNMAEIGGNHIRVDRAHPPSKKLKGENHFIYDIKRTIFVGNLPFDVMDEEVYQLFSGIEKLESSVEAIRVIRDYQTSTGKGIAYILFKTVDAAKLAVKKKNLKLRDRSLRVTMARPNSNTRQQREPNSRPKSTPITKSSGRKRGTRSEETSNITLVKKSKISLSYQGTKASKTVRHSAKLMRSTSMPNQQDKESKSRVFKRPAVAAKKASSLQSPGQNPAGIKRKWEGKTGYSKSPKKIRVG